MLPIRSISYLLPMCCSFPEKCKNSPTTGLGCSTPLNSYCCMKELYLHRGSENFIRMSSLDTSSWNLCIYILNTQDNPFEICAPSVWNVSYIFPKECMDSKWNRPPPKKGYLIWYTHSLCMKLLLNQPPKVYRGVRISDRWAYWVLFHETPAYAL